MHPSLLGHVVEQSKQFKGVTVLRRKTMRGALSILTAAISIIFFFIIRGPHINTTLFASVLTVLSVLGIIFAITSKKIWFIGAGIILNGAVLVFVGMVLFAIGMSEP